MNVVCSICLESLSASTTSHAVVLDCGHVYHKDCVSNWVKMKSNCPNCKATIKKKHFSKQIYFSTSELEADQLAPANPKVLEENSRLKAELSTLAETVVVKERESLQLRTQLDRQKTTIQYLKQLKRVADLDDDLAKPTSRSVIDSMKTLPRDELVTSLAALRSKLKHNKRETDAITKQLDKSNKIIDELVKENSKKDQELRNYKLKRSMEDTELNTSDTENAGSSKKKKQSIKNNNRRVHNKLYNGPPAGFSFNTPKAVPIDDDTDDDDESPALFTISEHKRGTGSSKRRHNLPGCYHCIGVPALPDDIESTRATEKCVNCARRLLHPVDGGSSSSSNYRTTANASISAPINIDDENTTSNKSDYIVLVSDDDSDETSDEL